MKNLLRLHEAIAVALLKMPDRTASFDELADAIDERGLYPNREGNISLAEQIRLRTTLKSSGYLHLFEKVGDKTIRLRNTDD